MIQYIYFVKCPECEDEPFDFFDEAQKYALSCIDQKPTITQIEVDRNDFGECVNSNDLGTVWSWEDIAKQTSAEPAVSIFTKDDLATLNSGRDPEFDALDNSLDDIPDNFRKPIPADMSIDALVEEMEENEDTVECKWCSELFDKSECRYEVDMGWLCDTCIAAIKSRGETLTFREGVLDESIAGSDETVELEYDKLTATITTNYSPATYNGPADWDEEEVTDSFTYEVSVDDVATAIWENFIDETDVVNVPGGLDALEDDAAWYKFLETEFDTLFKKYYTQLLDYFRDDAEEAAAKYFQSQYDDYEPDYEDDFYDFYDESLETAEQKKSVLEELEDGDAYRKRLTICPECGVDSFDQETGICISCGFN